MTQDWLTDDIDQQKPNSGRIFDYFLGGYHNLEIDRQIGEQVLKTSPSGRTGAQAVRNALGRIVSYIVEQGVTQIIDLGSGIPTLGNVHEVAQRANPQAKVVYVDIDPVAITHSQHILHDIPNVIAIQGDVNEPQAILQHPQVRELIDFDQPFAITLFMILHFITDDAKAYAIVDQYKSALRSGGYLAVGHATMDGMPQDYLEQVVKLYERAQNPGKLRTQSEVARFFEGLTLVEPGVVHPPQWHPQSEDEPFYDNPGITGTWFGLGRK